MKTQSRVRCLYKAFYTFLFIFFLIPLIAYSADQTSSPYEIPESDIKIFCGHIAPDNVEPVKSFEDVRWKLVSELKETDVVGKDEYWLKIPVSPKTWDNTGLYIFGHFNNMEIYLQGTKIVPSTQVGQKQKNFLGMTHIFSLPVPSENLPQPCFLYVRLFDVKKWGGCYFSKLCIGPMADLLKISESDFQQLFHSQVPKIMLSPILLFVGLISIGVFIARYKHRNYPFLSFGFFALASGINYFIYTITVSYFGFLFNYGLRIDLISSWLLPVGAVAFVGQMFPSFLTRAFRWMWRFHLLVALLVIAWAVAFSLPGFFEIIYYLLIFAYILTSFVSILKSHAGRRSIISVLVFFLFIGFALVDTLAGVNIISFGGDFFGYGIMMITVLMVYNLAVNYHQIHVKADNYEVELEVNKIKILELEQTNLMAKYNALKSQINPHFLFNTLGTLMSLIEEDQALAVDYVQELSNVYRYLLLMNDNRLVSVGEEIHFIKSYHYLVSKRFGQNVNLSIRIPEELFADQLPPLALQLLLENTLKHNIASMAKPLSINIFTEEGKKLVVQNNYQPKRSTSHSTGIGLSNLENRYSFFTDEKIQILSNEDSFTVKIPLIKDMTKHRGNNV